MSLSSTSSNYLMALFFTYAAYLQLNDADVLIWFPLYALSAILTLRQALVKEFQKTFILNLLVASFALALLVARSTQKVNFDHNTEQGRENFGLIIVAAWLILGDKLSRKPLIGLGVTGLALALVSTSAYVVPNFIANNTTKVLHYATDKRPIGL